MCVCVSVEWNTLQSPFYQGVAAGRLSYVQGCGHGHRGCTRDYGSEEAPWRHSHGTKQEVPECWNQTTQIGL